MLTRPRLRSGNASMIKTTGSFLGTVIVRFRRSHVFWALFLSRFSGFPDLLRDAQPGTAKGALGYREGFGRQPYFYTSIAHTCDKINTALFLWPMIWVLGHRSEGTDTGLGSFRPFRAAEATRPSFKLPGECGGIFRAVIIKKIVRKILVRKILVRKILVRKILVRKILVRKILVRKILVRKILVRKILGHLIAVGAPETVL